MSKMFKVFVIISIVSIPAAIGKFKLENKMWTKSLDGVHVKDIADYLAAQKTELWPFTSMDRRISPNTSARDLLFSTDVPNEYARTMDYGQESSLAVVSIQLRVTWTKDRPSVESSFLLGAGVEIPIVALHAENISNPEKLTDRKYDTSQWIGTNTSLTLALGETWAVNRVTLIKSNANRCNFLI